MKEELHQKKHWFLRGWKSLTLATFNIVAPPIAGKYHRRYDQRRWLLFIDTLFTLILFFLIATVLYFLTSKQLLPAPVVEATMSTSEVATNGGRSEIDIRLSNNGTLNVRSIEVHMNFPAEFVYESASLEPSQSDSLLWEIPELNGGQVTHLVIIGHIIGVPNSQPNIKALVQYLSGDQSMSQSLSRTFTISGELVSLTISAPETVRSGQEYSLTIQAVNNSEYELSTAAIEIKMPREFIQTNVTWPFEKDITRWAINNLKPHSEWNVRVSGYTTAANNQTSVFEITAVMLNNSLEFSQTPAKETVTILGSSGSTNTNTEPGTPTTKSQFVAEAIYYSDSGVQFGYGPLPPRVGETTGYRVFWRIKKGTESYENLTVEASLPETATWAGNSSVSFGQPLTYDEKTRTVTWPVGKFTGDQPDITASYEVTITPTVNDLEKFMTLCQTARVLEHAGTAVKSISTFPNITTTQVRDSQVAGQGIVQK
ncbi:MAG: hypothetical protein WC497_03765 [Patescibacteria group bacterium]